VGHRKTTPQRAGSQHTSSKVTLFSTLRGAADGSPRTREWGRGLCVLHSSLYTVRIWLTSTDGTRHAQPLRPPRPGKCLEREKNSENDQIGKRKQKEGQVCFAIHSHCRTVPSKRVCVPDGHSDPPGGGASAWRPCGGEASDKRSSMPTKMKGTPRPAPPSVLIPASVSPKKCYDATPRAREGDGSHLNVGVQEWYAMYNGERPAHQRLDSNPF
jgi:hypothetical protein